MALLFLLFNFNFLTGIVICYNLETSHPIIYEPPDDRGKSGYFGMTVTIRPKSSFLDNAWTIQVGAPRAADGVSTLGPGTVYRCHTYGPCRAFAVDKGLSAVGGLGIYEFKEKKDAAWIGVAMDVGSFGTHERDVVCGHRWMNQNLKNPENIDVTYLVTGACYLQDLLNETHELPVRRLLPLVNKDKIYTPKPYIDDLSTYHWGLGQAGLSVRLTEEPLNILIGAPGVTHWIGSVILYDENFQMTVGNFARADFARKNRYPYLGYSIAFGRFYKDREFWYAAGAPRSANYRGEDPSGDVRIQSSLTGATFGEYFGASLAAADLNSDGFDDLIVGAPLFSHRDPDEGRIYVYLGTEQGNAFVSAQVINGRSGHGRFGSCVTSVNDLDQDGFGDVAVGAPFENDQKGSVYIYRGFSKGLQTEYSQRIHAQDIHPHLRGFGVSISPAVDIDGNKYFDIAVGSHLSGHAVLLRSRPVISLHPRIKTEGIGLIDRRDSYFNVTVCLRYSGSFAPDNVGINRAIDVDPIYGRGTLYGRGSSSYNKIIRLRSNQIMCEIHSIILNLSGNNFSPLQITVRTEIGPCENGKRRSLLVKERKPMEEDGFQKTCPVGIAAETSKEIAFAGICGPDFVCRSDLEISCVVPEFRVGSYILGSTEFSRLSIEIKNHGEPAFDTRIKIWSNLKLKHRDEALLNGSSKTHWIDIDGILTDSYKVEFPFEIDLDPLTEGDTALNLMTEIFTSSSEEDLSNNYCRFSIRLTSDAVLDFRASSSVASVSVTKEMLKERTFNAMHYYEVQKTGVTPVKAAELTIYVPFYFKKEFLTFEVEMAEWMHLSHHLEKPTYEETKFEETSTNCPPTNRTLFLNCSASENGCKTLKIFFTGGIPTGFSSYVKIIMSLNVTAIDLVKDEKDIVHLSTIGLFKFSKFLEKPSELRATASVSLYEEEHDLHVDAHVVALSLLAGGFLLSLIITGLVKNNFFKRTKRQELKALKDAEATFVYFTTRPSFQGSC